MGAFLVIFTVDLNLKLNDEKQCDKPDNAITSSDKPLFVLTADTKLTGARGWVQKVLLILVVQ